MFLNNDYLNILSTGLSKRPYQKEAIKSLVNYVKDLLQGTLKEEGGKYEKSSLLEMATGSGKTFIVGKTIDLLIKLRNRYDVENYSGLNILVLSNRIDGVEQFRNDLVHGRKGEEIKEPIFSKRVLDNLKVSTFHSKADNIDDLDEKYFTQDEHDDEEIFIKQNGRNKDHIMFSTYQTASLKSLEEKLPYFDLIIIDEAHNVVEGNEFELLLSRLVNKGRNGVSPYILPLTATPTNLTEELFGEAIFKYGLTEYIASEYSPNIDYRLVTNSNVSKSEVENLNIIVEQAKNITDPKEKKQLVKQIQDLFLEMISSYPDLEKLVYDLLTRIILDNGEINETVIFAKNITEANDIAKEINKQLGDEIAISYHSQNDKNNALDRLKNSNDKLKIIVAIDKLNESIDLPVIANIVFWRLTDVARIFLQQFGRGLRGKGTVRFYDYVGSLKNFSWIGNIYEEYKKCKKNIDTQVNEIDNDSETEKKSKFNLLGGNLSSGEHTIDFSSLGFEISKLNESLYKFETLEDYQKYFNENKQEFLDYWIKIDEENKKIDLKDIGAPSLSVLFGKMAYFSINKLNIVMGNNDEGKVTNKKSAQKILKQFFELMGYTSDIGLHTLEDYQKNFKKNQQEFLKYGIKIDEVNKNIDLNNLGNSCKIKLFGRLASNGLRQLNIIIGNKDEGFVVNKPNSQKILKQFFEGLGYNVEYKIEEIVKLSSLYYYQKYFKENQQEFLKYGIKIDDVNKNIDLNNVGSPNTSILFGRNACNGLRQLNIIIGNKDEGVVKNKINSQKILKQFFEGLGYNVEYKIEEIVKLSSLDNYQKYFKENQQEFLKYGIKIDEINKNIDLNNILSPKRVSLFGKLSVSSLRNLNISMGNIDFGRFNDKSNAQKILKQFFEGMGYIVI